jgi:serine/threonine-protein kinase HipA
MKQAKIVQNKQLAGILTEDENGYTFLYESRYLELPDTVPVSLTLPLQEAPYRSNVLFPFFDGLIPEGWLLDIAGRNWKINERDRMSLLLACCKDCIGSVSVVALENQSDE